MASLDPIHRSVYVVGPSSHDKRTPTQKVPFSLSLRRVTVRLPDGRLLLDDVDAVFGAERVGLVGRNGSGKSVLARTLVGLVIPDSGSIRRSAPVALVPQEARVEGRATVVDVAGLTETFDALERVEKGQVYPADFELLEERWNIRTQLAQALTDAGLGYLQPGTAAISLSGGEWTRVALIGAFLSRAKGLVLDEPTNHLDENARKWLGDKLRQWRGGLIVVSHDRALLDEMDRIVEVKGGHLRSFGGNYSFYRAQRETEAGAARAALDHARTQRERGLRDLRRQHDALQRRAARNSKAAKVANLPGIYLNRLREGAEAFAGRERLRHQETREALETSVRHAAERVDAAPPVALMLPANTVAASKRVVEMVDAVAPFPRNAPPLMMTLTGPVRVGISGPNGCGKTTLLRMVAGTLSPLSGRSQAFVHTAWLDQHFTSLLPPGKSVLQRLNELDTPLPEEVLRSHLALLGLRQRQVRVRSECLSGGERLKAALACALWGGQPAQLLLLDEPTNHLDLDSMLAFERAVGAYSGALFVASHDRRFLTALRLTHTLVFVEGTWRLSTVQ